MCSAFSNPELVAGKCVSIINDSGHGLTILYFTFGKNPKEISLVESITQENKKSLIKMNSPLLISLRFWQ